MGNSTRDSLTAYGEQFKKQMALLKGKPRVKAGIVQRDFNTPAVGEKTDATLGDIAVYMEFGTVDGRIPARSWLRSTVDAKANNLAGWLGEVKEIKKDIIAGKLTVEQGLGRIGMMMKRDLQAKVRSNIPPANRPSTIARKKSSATLIDKGQFLNAIDYVVEMVEKIV